MRIVYLHQYFNTRDMVGGTRSYEMARRLVARGHDVQLVTSARDPERGRPGTWRTSTTDGIRVHWLPVPYHNRMGYRDRLVAFARFAWGAAAKAADLGGDLIFATSTPLTIALPAVYAARRNRLPMVLEVRDLWPEVPVALGALRHPVSIAAARWLERFAYRHAARVVALSPGIRDGVMATGYPAERVTVIPNASDRDLFDVPEDAGRAVRASHPWLGDRPLVLYTGTLGPLNGVGYLAQLAAHVQRADPETRFVVIGEGKEEVQVRETARALGVLDRSFFLLPSRPKTEIPAWLSAADVAVSVVVDRRALWANSANKVFDAFAAGRPVAINHEGWLADLLRDSGAGLVLEARDHQAAAASLARVLRDPQWRADARGAARRLARGQFDRDRLADLLADTLARAVADRVPNPAPRPAQADVA